MIIMKKGINKILKNKAVAIFLTVVLLILFTLFVMKMVDNIYPGGDTVLIKTSMGDITIELNRENAPITVENFLSYVDSSFYDDLVFHRVMSGFMIQGGGFEISGEQKKTDDPIKLESDNSLKNSKYTIAMARTNVPDSATSQFFINAADNLQLDYSVGNPGYAVFGNVIDGEEIVDEINVVKTGSRGHLNDWPVEDVIIYSIERI